MTRAYIALGANLGDRLAQLARALHHIDDLDTAEVWSVSRAYESEPWGVTEQAPFANAVAAVDTELRGDQLLGILKDIESEMGRRPGQRYGPRPIDLDILLIGDDEWVTPDLIIPHPRMLERAFVVVPLLDVAPDARMPDGSRIRREAAVEGRITGVLGPIPGFVDRTAWGEGDPAVPELATPPGAPAARDAAEGYRSVPESESWVPVYQRPGYNSLFELPSALANGLGSLRGSFVPGAVPNVEANFAQVVLTQMGIPHAWDPFDPELSSDPYNLSRPFRLLAPESMAAEAIAALAEAASAEIEWEGIDWDGEPDSDDDSADD